jgi:hypothetical protein
MTLDHYTARVLYSLVLELCSELDLHHEDGQMSSLQKSMQAIADAVGHMKRHGCLVPEAYGHLMKRYERSGAQTSHPISEDPQ